MSAMSDLMAFNSVFVAIEVVIPFRLNISVYDVLIASFSFSVGGASCPALEQLNSRRLCNVNLEIWYKFPPQTGNPNQRRD